MNHGLGILDELLDCTHALPECATNYGIGIVGFGNVARRWHMTAYNGLGLNVVGAYDTSPEARADGKASYPHLRWYDSYDEMLADPAIQVVDIATGPVGRETTIDRALDANKHVLAQKPAGTDVAALARIAQRARDLNLKVAVNQNGRWAPPWLLASTMIEEGCIGDIQAVTHIFDTRITWTPNPARHGTTQFLLFDYSIHWIDITRCWLVDKTLIGVRAGENHSREALPDGMISQTMWMVLDYSDGTSALLRGVVCAKRHTGHPFWIHGTGGTIRGHIDSREGDYVELETDTGSHQIRPSGNWFPDGFAGSISELLRAIHEDREPVHSLSHNLGTLAVAMAACDSARLGGERVQPVAGPDALPN